MEIQNPTRETILAYPEGKAFVSPVDCGSRKTGYYKAYMVYVGGIPRPHTGPLATREQADRLVAKLNAETRFKGVTNMKSIRDDLVGAVIAFDQKQAAKAAKSPRAYHNVYALPQYLARIDDVMDDVKQGASVSAAVNAGFMPGPLRNACRKALGLPKDDAEASGSYKGLPVYQKVSG